MISGTANKVGGDDNYILFQIAVDGAGSVWAATSTSLSEFNNNDVALSPSSAGFAGGTATGKARTTNTYKSVSVDRSGNVWLPAASSTGDTLLVIVGAATPVYTPLLPGHEGALP